MRRWSSFSVAVALLIFACGNQGPYAADRASALTAARGQRTPAPRLSSSTADVAPAGQDQNDPNEAKTRGSMLSAQVEVPPIRPAVVEHPEALRHFFESLSHLEDGSAREDVLVMQLGDSHTAADIGTSAARRALQARFGDGGRGFVAFGRPWPTYVQDGVRGGMTRDFKGERGKFSFGQFVGDGRYGMAGFAIESNRKRGRAWSDLSASASRIEFSFLEQPGGGSFEVFIDDVKKGVVSTRQKTAKSGFRAFDVGEGPHHVEARPRGDGPVRLFGLDLGRSKVGLVFDALGINGARATTVLQWQEPHMAEQLRHQAPDLVILAYGTNEAGDDIPLPVYERQLLDVLGRISRAVPTASCLLLGPPDRGLETPQGWVTVPRLLEIIESQRNVAKAAGCAFYSQLDAMGGPGSIAAWVDEPQPRARRDYVHLTREGYTQLGQAMASDLLRAYDASRSDSNLVSKR
ncbi:GDSL-type esterase/lipase family protein [Pendulispora brunnea]|uniref:GDSL-type esterase/lipase family protein n=1 Tax=Pendulispora brunnea TaxID=2905690 RepID=A0ABZ2K6M6_9BACT